MPRILLFTTTFLTACAVAAIVAAADPSGGIVIAHITAAGALP